MNLALLTATLLGFSAATFAADKGPLPIAEVQRAEPVNFDRDLLPFLNDNCLACHCKTTTKGGLNLETPELMLKGGESGPALVPKKSAESLVLQAAAHLDADLAMPPRDNKAKAKNLTPEQLGLLKLWIDQGAKVFPKIERVVKWQPLAESLGAIFAVAITGDGQFAACSRENRMFVYHLPSGRCVLNEAAHRDQINALAFHPDGTLLASGGYREVKLWRRTKEVQKLSLAEAGPRAAISPDGKWLATGGADGEVKLWSWPEGKPARTLAVSTGTVVAFKFSPDSTKIACAAADKSLTIWNTADGQEPVKAEAPVEITALAWLPDGHQLATGGADKIVRLWSDALAPGKELKGHTGAITALETLAPNRLVSGSADGSLKIWEVGKDAPVLSIVHGGPVAALAVRPDGLRFAAVGADGIAKLWGADGKAVGTPLRGNRYVREAADAAGRNLQVETGNVAFCKAAAGVAEKQIESGKERVKKATEAIPSKKQEREAKQILVAEPQAAKATAEKALADAEAALKNAGESFDAAMKAEQEAKAAADALKTVTPLDQPAIERALADAAARAQDSAKAKAEREKSEAQRKQAADQLEPAAKKLAAAEEVVKKAETAVNVAEGELKLAQAEEPKLNNALMEAKAATEAAEAVRKLADEALKAAQLKATEAEQPPVRAVAFAADNRTLATAGEDLLVHTWNSETGEASEIFQGHAAAISSLAFAPSGDLISTATDRAAIAWNLAPAWKLERTFGTGEPKSPLVDRVNALSFSHDGKLLATGGGEPSRAGEIKLWNVATGELVRDLPNTHGDTVLGLEFSPDDKLLATSAADRMARIVDLATGKTVRSFEGHTHHVLGVSWSPDGRTLVTAGADNMAKVWDATNGERKKNLEGFDKEVTAIHFAGVSGNVLTSSGDNKVRLLALDGREIRAFPEVADFMQSAATSADGKIVIAGGQDGVLRVWKAADGAKLGVFGPAAK